MNTLHLRTPGRQCVREIDVGARALCAFLLLAGSACGPSPESLESWNAEPVNPIGHELPILHIVRVGTNDTVTIGGVRPEATIVMFALESCAACQMSMANWQQLVGLSGAGVRFVRIYLPSGDRHSAGDEESVGEITMTDVELAERHLPLEATPTFFVIAPDGKVREAIVGQLNASRVSQIRHAIVSVSGMADSLESRTAAPN